MVTNGYIKVHTHTQTDIHTDSQSVQSMERSIKKRNKNVENEKILGAITICICALLAKL